MTHRPTQKLISNLDALLDSEHELLLLGKLDEIAQLATEKEKAFEELSLESREAKEELAHIHDKIVRNQRLLKSASQGIRAVSERMAALRRVRSGLQTYDRSGNKKTVGKQGRPTLEKRA